ncbi:MAG: cysteine desulfurase family protein [Patescibacteria group bacterium]|jgi:cysteine desulfurase|nr:cysteine desulfurase family protein [Patescibacteria group bacterium]
MRKIYLDYAATTPTDSRVVKAMKPYFSKIYGNASSLHKIGQKSKLAMNKARAEIAQFINARSEEIIFTSGGTEANNLAIKGIFFALNLPHKHIITSKIEHHAVLEPCRFLEKQNATITHLPVDKYGLVNIIKLQQAIKDETILISIMHANNETGVIQPIKEISQIVQAEKERRQKEKINIPIYFHTDAVQTFSHLPLDVHQLNIDLLSASAHKLYGPKGIGLLYLKQGVKIESLIHGGEHEKGKRASTENIPGIVGFAKAVELAKKEMNKEQKRLMKMRDYFINKIIDSIKDSHLNGHAKMRLANNINISIKGIEGEAMMINLDSFGIACSTGSACSSTSLEPSHVLLAMSLGPELAHSSLRFTLGRWTKKKDLDYTIKKLIFVVNRLRNISSLKIKI